MTAQTTTEPRVTEIGVRLQNLGDFFDPNETEGVDIAGSIESYAQVLRDRLTSVYPEAAITVGISASSGILSTVVSVTTDPDYPHGPLPADPDEAEARVDLEAAILGIADETRETVKHIAARLYEDAEIWIEWESDAAAD